MQRRVALAAIAATASAPAGALYDQPPHPALALAAGVWAGTLTYRDWSNPERLVTLRCRQTVALTAPDGLALHCVFDDGPGKTVHGYDRMVFDFAASSLLWTSGVGKPSQHTHRLTSVQAGAEDARVAFERDNGAAVDHHLLVLTRRTWWLDKTEHAADGRATLRNRYELVRSEGAP